MNIVVDKIMPRFKLQKIFNELFYSTEMAKQKNGETKNWSYEVIYNFRPSKFKRLNSHLIEWLFKVNELLKCQRFLINL